MELTQEQKNQVASFIYHFLNEEHSGGAKLTEIITELSVKVWRDNSLPFLQALIQDRELNLGDIVIDVCEASGNFFVSYYYWQNKQKFFIGLA